MIANGFRYKPGPLEDGPVPVSDMFATLNVTDATQGYPDSFDTRKFTMHPLGMVAHLVS